MVLDTHIWYWWVVDEGRLSADQLRLIHIHEPSGLYVSAMSLVEVARASALGGMALPKAADAWLREALAYPGVRLVEISPDIAVDAYGLPEPFHRDPADRLIVATARVLNLPLLTADEKILAYPHVLLAA